MDLPEDKGLFRLCAVTLEDIDLTSTSDRILFKILGLNLVIVLVCCILGNFGVMALLVYTVILFFVLKKYTRVSGANIRSCWRAPENWRQEIWRP